MRKKRIAIFTGNRAEYGLLVPVIESIRDSDKLDYSLIVSGGHLDPEFGNTIDQIKKDGFEIAAEIKLSSPDDTRESTPMAIGQCILEMVKTLKKINPDILVVYADRFEGFASVIAGSQMNVPIAHIEGGDLTEGGALDDSVRHAMTKLAHLHFVTNEGAKRRVIGMGEESWRVLNIGLPSLDVIGRKRLASAKEISEKYCLDLERPIVLFTQHSVTTEFDQAGFQIDESINSLKRLALEGVQVVITYPNNDAGGKKIIQKLKSLHEENVPGIQLHASLGSYFYHGILSLAKDSSKKVVCVGNSSSGIKETCVFKCPTVNIGSRQKGRLRAENVIDANYSAAEIYEKVKFCLEDVGFRVVCRATQNPYGEGGAGDAVAKYLEDVELGPRLLQKKMML
jgi:UDP-hydrolysing UDP-N-acetyl-D-glucosamine 2-epimerase